MKSRVELDQQLIIFTASPEGRQRDADLSEPLIMRRYGAKNPFNGGNEVTPFYFWTMGQIQEKLVIKANF